MNPTLMQVLSLVGAILVLIAYGGNHYAGLRNDGLPYGLLNLIGALLLASSAIVPLNLGVLVMESAWALISLGVLARALRGRRVASDRSH